MGLFDPGPSIKNVRGAVLLFIFMEKTSFESLAEFASEDVIFHLVAKERGKYAAKIGKNAENPFASDPLFQELRAMTPPHKLWGNPGRGKLPLKATEGLAVWTYKKRRAAVRVYQAIKKKRSMYPDAPWVRNLNEFVLSVQNSLSGAEPLILESPQILSKFKEQDAESGDFIYRPICKYSDLKTKIILALAYQYILAKFDKYFHRNMLFMRAARRVEGKRYEMPKYTDAIDLVSDFRRRNNRKPIYVGECDIQKFYDIFNHDVIVKCFEDLFDEAKLNDGAEDKDFDSLRRVIVAYLDSFNYPEHVMRKNDDPDYWKNEVRRHRSDACPEPVCRFKWVSDDAFVSSGCYTEEELQAAKVNKKLGIPQGGPLSGIIVNVVMRVVDKPIVASDSPDKLFIRYCDDILLMHTDKVACENYLECYCRQLKSCKLVPHRQKDVADCKSGRKTKAEFWHSKSKDVYLWGPGDGAASDWVAFVGYEMRRTGEIRIRKDKIDEEFKRIAHQYYNIIYSKKVTSGEPVSEEDRLDLIKGMDDLSEHILNYVKVENNVYARSQARRLDKYLYRKTRQAAARIGIADPKKAARERVTYLDQVTGKVTDNKADA